MSKKIEEYGELQTIKTPDASQENEVLDNNPMQDTIKQMSDVATVKNNLTVPLNQENIQSNNKTTNTSQNSIGTYSNTSVQEIPQNSMSIMVPSDLNDATVQNYLNDYKYMSQTNNYQGQINALTGIDKYRVSQGLEPIYTQNIYELTNQRNQKINSQIKDYENRVSEYANNNDFNSAQQVGKQLEAYKKSVGYEDNIDNSATFLKNVEYKSTYDEVINNIVSELLTSRFTYDPSDDQALAKAQQYATNTVYESMNAKGILDSTMTAAIVTETVNNLIPTYENMAKEDFYKNIERLQSMASLVINLEDKQYERWADNVQMNLQYYEALKDEVSYQYDRVNKLGYVDNQASVILGIPVGTMSPAKREAIEEAQQKTQEKYNELMSDIELYKAKKRIDAQYSTTTKSQSVSSNYTGMSDTDKKTTIKAQYEAGEIDEYEAVNAIMSNFSEAKQSAMYYNILGITSKEAEKIYIDGQAKELLTELENKVGNATYRNMDNILNGIQTFKDAGMPDEIIESMKKQATVLAGYDDLSTKVAKPLETMNSLIESVNENKLTKKELEKILKGKEVKLSDGATYKLDTSVARSTKLLENEEEKFKEVYGEQIYSALYDELSNIENEIESKLKELEIKVDW